MADHTLGFIGTGAMGEPMCRNLAARSGRPVIAYDLDSAPLERLAADGVQPAASAAALAERADIVLLSLPGGPEVEAVARGALLPAARPGRILVDLSTTPVGLTRELAAAFEAAGAAFIDAPVARTQPAAVSGTLSIMVGGAVAAVEQVRPYLACMGSDITHCGAAGCGQIAKILNNMVVMQTGVAVAEAVAIARAAGMDAALLLETLAKGSADSFVLRNHGLQAMVPGRFPEGQFKVPYAQKDLSYALMLAEDGGVTAAGAQLAHDRLEAVKRMGFVEQYWPVLLKAIEAGR